MMQKSITVYCGSRGGSDPKWSAIARACGEELVSRQWALVFGGGKNGLMGELARTVIELKGHATGIIPENLLAFEPAMENLTELFVVDSMHTRKALMSERADAFLVLPGGIGTFEEFFEVWTWRQIGLHNKPIVLLNAHGYYNGMLEFLQGAVLHGFMTLEHHCHLGVATNVKEAFDLLDIPCPATTQADPA